MWILLIRTYIITYKTKLQFYLYGIIQQQEFKGKIKDKPIEKIEEK